MALLNKLFFPSTSSSSSSAAQANTSAASSTSSARTSSTSYGKKPTTANKRPNNNQTVHSKNYLSQFPFDGHQVRVLLYRECDRSGRRLLFDSDALEKVSLSEANANHTTSTSSSSVSKETTAVEGKKRLGKQHSTDFIEVCKEYGFKHNRPRSSDITSFGEMVFGALAMSFRGTALKVHWLQSPPRILYSQVFLAPMNTSHGHQSVTGAPMKHHASTPRTSISSEQGSIDNLSMNSFSMPFSISVGRHLSLTPSDHDLLSSSSVDVPALDQQSVSTNSSVRTGSGPRYSATYSTATDSGYSGMSRSRLSSDQWSASYQYSTRSSLGSVMSDQSDPMRKLSIDSSFYPTSPHLKDVFSDGSLQRRVSRNLRTSFENEYSMNDLIGFISDNYPQMCNTGGGGGGPNGGSEGGCIGQPTYRRASYGASESRSNPEIGNRRDVCGTKALARRAKLGLAVCISLSEPFAEEMELFCSEHIALLENMLIRLRACTERAYLTPKDFLQVMYQAWLRTQQWFIDLFTAPRIKCPVWLSITTSGSKYSKSVAERFVDELCWLLSLADTKDTNFFVSTVLTAILTHHLGWVSTVSAFNSRSENSTAAIEQRAKLQQVSQKHPYNALWAQLGDLYGAIGIPSKLARTVIYGSEKISVERLLNVLTYFIRCGEVRRSAKREDFNKDLIDSFICQNNNEVLKKAASYPNKAAFGMRKTTGSGGLVRTQTCKQNLNTISDTYELSSGGEDEGIEEEQLVRTQKRNEIPNVLVYRDSHFVQQELRVGNYLMDTGLEKNPYLLKQGSKEGRIRLTVTTPDNVEMNVEEENANSGGSTECEALEAIEIDTPEEGAAATGGGGGGKKNFLWTMVPQVVKEGLSLVELEKLQNKMKFLKRKEDCVSLSSSQLSGSGSGEMAAKEKKVTHTLLSDLITQNSMGQSDRMTWGIEPIKENVSLEEQIHFDICQKQIEREHSNCRKTEERVSGEGNAGSGGSVNNSNSGVVFVLGENEPLVNLKKSNEDLTEEPSRSTEIKSEVCQTLCPLHQQTLAHTHSKKHSGVKFNFAQYPQIATNYMKNKNLVLSNYDLLMDKCTKLELNESSSFIAPSGSSSGISEQYPQTGGGGGTVSLQTNCIICNSISNSYQTPSNATELEFEAGEEHSYTPTASATVLHPVGSTASVDTLKSAPRGSNEIVTSATVISECTKIESMQQPTSPTSPACALKRHTFSFNPRKVPSRRGSISSVAAKCAAVNETTQLLKLPVPGIKESPQEEEAMGDMKLRAGFVPSLFFNVSNHYVSDMVLQGTFAKPKLWEMNLREDLALSAHSASLISLPAENVAIVADMEKWDVRLISSQAQYFPYAGGQSSPVGMSQLVSSMLETVQMMHSEKIAAYECLSFLESKLQEIYLHSETLATFLLETDFCSLTTVTSALNLSENDVPLLISIASIHTPQISKKCGISFR